MRKILILTLICTTLFGKININDASRYELMTLGKISAGQADMLINFRKKREITDVADLRVISGFEKYDTEILEKNFDFSPKAVQEIPKKTQTKVITKTRYINQYPTYEKIENYGDIQIIERGSSYYHHKKNPNFNESSDSANRPINQPLYKSQIEKTRQNQNFNKETKEFNYHKNGGEINKDFYKDGVHHRKNTNFDTQTLPSNKEIEAGGYIKMEIRK